MTNVTIYMTSEYDNKELGTFKIELNKYFDFTDFESTTTGTCERLDDNLIYYDGFVNFLDQTNNYIKEIDNSDFLDNIIYDLKIDNTELYKSIYKEFKLYNDDDLKEVLNQWYKSYTMIDTWDACGFDSDFFYELLEKATDEDQFLDFVIWLYQDI